jgi:hypothetical protein
MKNSAKMLLVCCLAPLLMAIQCDDDFGDTSFVYPIPQVGISEGPNFTVNDTIWLKSRVTSKIFDEITGDSIADQNDLTREIISVMRLNEATDRTNALPAISEFDFVKRTGNIDFLGACPEADLVAKTELVQEGQFFEYEIGIIPKNLGDFVLSWVEPVTLKNNNLHIEILSRYPLEGSTTRLGLSKCGIGSFFEDVIESRSHYFFSVE